MSSRNLVRLTIPPQQIKGVGEGGEEGGEGGEEEVDFGVRSEGEIEEYLTEQPSIQSSKEGQTITSQEITNKKKSALIRV